MDNITKINGPLLIPIDDVILTSSSSNSDNIIFDMNLINILPSICEDMEISLIILLFNKTIHSADPEDSKISYVENILQWKIDKSIRKTYISSCHMYDEELFHDIAVLYTNSYLSEMDYEDMDVIEETRNKSVILVKDYNDAFATWGKEMEIGVINCNDLYKLKR